MRITKARVENGVVVESVFITDIPFPNSVYRAELEYWITGPEEVSPGWLYDGENFTPPVE
jgi:hypothetical protein